MQPNNQATTKFSESIDCLEWKKKAIKKTIEEGVIPNEPLVMLYNLNEFRKVAQESNQVFGGLQTMAVKCNPVMSLLKEANKCGLGAEVASFGELKISEAAGFSPDKIVFDSPIKTRSELEYAINLGCKMNVDNFQELERIKEIVAKLPSDKVDQLVIGIRVNPQVAAGKLADLSTGVPTSKFGIGMEYKDQIVQEYRNNRWLKTIHVHVGSQGFEMSAITNSASIVFELTKEINVLTNDQIKFFNIGGGLSVNFESEQINPTFTQYSQLLRETLPELFNGKYILITEFGRSYWAKCGVVVSNIEYHKVSSGREIGMVHGGANLFVRTIYQYPLWKFRLTIFDQNGKYKSGEEGAAITDLGGPCCFASDLLCQKTMLPLLTNNDFVMVHDTGAYCLSAYSHYNLRLAPPIYAYEESDNSLVKIKKGETIEDIINFFS
ncbi:group IV decarboxylase [Tieghemostelium lacteum]|uniref:Group IV decarboxylase n=1 Tax=Tieghemostelium lacteum TaxID=361077 RepID=A0A151Z9W7_TIELA|nr:group IV decarboxylase [Tieghemostelium lacteum]|eukprot:KYQ90740.1 group IV decarboxylase [Tieghemostelium lacteum]